MADSDLVSADEIRDFRTSMSARRFPALRDLRDEDVASLVLAERKARLARGFNAKPPATSSPRRTRRHGPLVGGELHLHTHDSQQPLYSYKPTAGSSSPRNNKDVAAHAQQQTMRLDASGRVIRKPPPFSPANPSKARDEITRAGKHSQFASVGTPYEAEVFRYVPEEHLLPFVPCSASEAKKKVMVNYYLNSPDAETQYMERVTIAARAADNTAHLRNEMSWERGHQPSRHKIVVLGATGEIGGTVGVEESRGFVGGLATPAGKRYGDEGSKPQPPPPLGDDGEDGAAAGGGEEGAAGADVEGGDAAPALAQLSADAAEEAAAAAAAGDEEAAGGEYEEVVAAE